MAIESDKGYVWVVVVASTVIMFFGPSTLSAYGNMTGEVKMGNSERTWALVTLACFMYSTAILVGPLSDLMSYRKVALLGCLLAASGFLLSGSSLGNPKWIFLTLSTFVGIGVGFAIHATFLVVALHFTRYRGLAIGILGVSAGAGNIFSPVVYDFMSDLRDRYHLRALVATIGFMAATFYTLPPRSSGVSLASTRGENNADGGSLTMNGKPKEVIPLVETKDGHEGPPPHMLQQRRPSRFMEAIAATLPPEIPEESESEDPSKCPSVDEDEDSQTTCSSIRSVFESADVDHVTICIPGKTTANMGRTSTTSTLNNNNGLMSTVNGYSDILMAKSESSHPHLSEEPVSLTHDKDAHQKQLTNVESTVDVKTKSRCDKDLHLILRIVADMKFLNMATLSSLVMITVPNFPIVLYANLVQSGEKSEKDNVEGDCVMYLIFSFDLLSRLLTSYLSDFPSFNRRVAFLCGTACGAIVITAIGSVHDIRLIYILSAIYGLSSGVLMSTESLMFADVFGIEQFPTVYGLVGLCKALLILIISAAVRSPCSSYEYMMGPVLHPKVNDTICTNCDPFGLFGTEENPLYGPGMHTSLLRFLAIPGFVCTVAWYGEMVLQFIRSRTAPTPKSDLKLPNTSLSV